MVGVVAMVVSVWRVRAMGAAWAVLMMRKMLRIMMTVLILVIMGYFVQIITSS